MKNAIRLILSLLLSAGFLWAAFHAVDFKQVWHAMHAIRPGYVAAYVITLMVVQVARAWRWDVLVQPFAQLPWRQVWRISNVGNMLIMILPLRLGELGRPYLMKKAGARFTSTVGAVAVERILDGLLVTLLFFATTRLLPAQYVVPDMLRYGALVALGIFASATVVVVAALATHGLVPRVLRKLGKPVAPALTEKVIGMVDSFVHGLRALPNAKAVLSLVGWTVGYWFANALGMYWLMLAFNWDLPLMAGFTVVCVLVIGIMIPAGPGFLGTYQAAIVTALAVFGVAQSDALAYSLVAYILNLAVVVGCGLPYLFGSGGLRVGDMVRESESEDSAEAPMSRQSEPC